MSDPRPMACPGCIALPLDGEGPQARADDILLSLPDIHCQVCIRTAEQALTARDDVAAARVNLTLKRAYVTPQGDVSDDALIETLAGAGILAQPLDPSVLRSTETARAGQALLMRLAVAGFAAMNVMLLSVAVWSGATDATRDLFHWISAAIALPAVTFAGQPFFMGAWRALSAQRLSMDVPIALAIILALGTSLWETALSGHHAYFDAALTLCFFLLAGRYLEFRTRAAARSAAEELTALEVPRATRIIGGVPVDGPVAELSIDDLVLVRAGGRVPVDGIVTDGHAELDRSLLTGETIPVAAGPGTAVAAGEVVISGPLTIRATAVGRETSLHRLADLVAVAEAGRANYTPLADRAAALYAPGVHILAALAFVGWLIWAGDMRVALNIAAAVLIITCPCALGLAVPAVTTAASGALFRKGVLIKNATALERLAAVDTVVFDKTGTLTEGAPEVMNWNTLGREAQSVALALADASTHPLSKAIARLSGDRAALTAITEVPGFGTQALWRGKSVRIGRAGWAGPEEAGGGLMTWLDLGAGAPLAITFTDSLRAGAVEAVAALKNAGLHVEILSGDREGAVADVALAAGIDTMRANCLPEDKVDHIAALHAEGRTVLMVGDGLNDTGALAAADVSLSPATALDAARVASDMVLLGQSLAVLPDAVQCARAARRRISENFQIATVYNIVAVPLAVIGLATPLIAALAMSSSSITVSLNALRGTRR
ncbi:heavy metal translocating P-type ATPase [uncultured Tateyamaria sp.]|uniref:heavy metal translocating P-type ATPase n=1 Tax=uncultured Tateyamaria sp. TaxID=455651 RepID=UPI00262F218A|nr:heavy metal translocating P-type ATPase [uncultured Tateyamaria sp.]